MARQCEGRHLKHDADVVVLDLKGVEDVGELPGELHIDDGTDHLVQGQESQR